MASSFRVLIAGGGVAGLEALLALRDLAGDRVDVTLVSPEHDFAYRAIAVGQSFGRGHQEQRSLAGIAADAGARFVQGELASVDDAARTAVVPGHGDVAYDALLVAVGARGEPAFRHATTWTPEADPEIFGGLLRDIEEGYAKEVAFVVPPGATWPLPAYELALMTAWDAHGMGQDDVAVTVYTHEDAPLAAFGPRAAVELRADLVEAGVHVETGVWAQEGPDGLVLQPGDRPLSGARVVALPVAAGRAIPGLPADARGFIPADLHGRVPGLTATWVAGDAMAFPIKQGGLAAQEADAAAEDIAARAGADVTPQPLRPVLRGVVLTGRGRQWMRRSLDGDAGDADAVTADGLRDERHALWWPPTKIAGRYLSPLLAELDERGLGAQAPSGHPVELDVEESIAAAADAMRLARDRDPQSIARQTQ